ncbi:MAG TPA: multidrug efflux RND transporter permease subunit [Candidatus Dormibacteraeota bacterium]|nr:multidrug efflux RND transporter permease subunit [Candidatus Dormibacteraeota bacterium]
MNFSSNFSAPFIRRPVATTLLTFAIFLSGAVAFKFLPVAPLPRIDFPTIAVGAGLPGASPETMASNVAAPLERQFGRISGVTQMTSSSTNGSTSVVLQFDLNRDINAAARDVQAAINAARSQLPADLPGQPTYRKVNPADAPILLLSLTSTNVPGPQIYDAADSILAQKLAQVEGVGQVFTWGSSRPAVRVAVNPDQVNSYGISLEQVRTALRGANANLAKGSLSDSDHSVTIADTDQLFKAYEYQPLVVAGHVGAPVRLQDIATVTDSVEDVRNLGLSFGEPSVILAVFRQPDANMIETVDRIKAIMPELSASISPSLHLRVAMDRTTTIRASIHDVEITLLISISLVILVVFVFLRNVWATIIPSIAVPLSLVGTFGVMYLCGYSLDNLSLMALTISTGFVVDDAIVVIENIARHIEAGMKPFAATMKGASEIGFTVLSMSSSLVAVFIPILLFPGIVGRLFREFAITLTAAITVSMVVSLTTTPMMCARFLRHEDGKHNFAYRLAENAFNGIVRIYDRCLRVVLRHQFAVLLITIGTVCLNGYLFYIVPKGFFPQQDTGRINGSIQGDQDTSFANMSQKMIEFTNLVLSDPAVETATSFAGGGNGGSTARMFAQLKPLEERKMSSDEVIARLRRKAAKIPGATLFMQSVQDLTIGGRFGAAQYQYTLQAEKLDELNTWAPKLLEAIKKIPGINDANSDQQVRGLQTSLVIDRDTASRLGVNLTDVDNTLGDAFGQRQVSNIYKGLNQYHVVLEVQKQYTESPDGLNHIYLPSSSGKVVPLGAFAHYEPTNTSLSVNHQGLVPSITLSFNLAPSLPLGDAVKRIEETQAQLHMPPTVHGGFQGTAQTFQDSQSSVLVLIITALAAVYIILGILYESFIHPITILSTLPSAGVGALLTMMFFKTELTLIALIGIILLIGIVKKNAILMIDFAVQAETQEGLSPIESIHKACLLRFRPILMTTMAALLGALPLALGHGTGSELRRPLGIAIVGGLVLSQLLTLFTTPVVYLYMDRVQIWLRGRRAAHHAHRFPLPAQAD